MSYAYGDWSDEWFTKWYDRIPKVLAAFEGTDEESDAMVVEAMAGCPKAVFTRLDEKPGEHGYERDGREWHWRLRRVRNDVVLGLQLWEGLT